MALAAGAPPPRSKGQIHLGFHQSSGGALDSKTGYPSTSEGQLIDVRNRVVAYKLAGVST
jgi:hypothetical protein